MDDFLNESLEKFQEGFPMDDLETFLKINQVGFFKQSRQVFLKNFQINPWSDFWRTFYTNSLSSHEKFFRIFFCDISRGIVPRQILGKFLTQTQILKRIHEGIFVRLIEEIFEKISKEKILENFLKNTRKYFLTISEELL